MLTPILSNRHRVSLAIGDVLTFLAFAALGRRAHSMGNALDDLIATALPFLLAWFIVAPFTGAYGAGATQTPKTAAQRSALTWLVAFPLGLLLRIPIVGRLSHISFVLVAGLFTLLMLVGWRTLFARLTRA